MMLLPDKGSGPGSGAGMLVGQIGENRDVLCLGFCQLSRCQTHDAGEDEEHHEAQQHHGGTLEDGIGFLDDL